MPPTPQNSTIPAESALPPPILRLPHELLLLIIRNAVSSNAGEEKDTTQAAHTTAALSQTCKLFRALTTEVLHHSAKQLVTLIVEGKAEQAKAMIAANPELMFVKIKGQVETPGSGIDDEGLAFHGIVTAQSPLQVALGEGDFEIYHYMASFFDKVLDDNEKPIGRERAKKQFYEKFPGGNIKYPPCEYDLNQARVPFSSIINAITNDTALRRDQNDREWDKTRRPTEATKTVLRKFRKDFMPGIFTTGHHFNLNNLLKAFELYVQCFDNWNWNQRSLFWCQVIGYLQRLVPAVVAQAFCQGLYYLLEQKQPLERGLELHSWVTNSRVSYFGDSGHAGLGFDFAIYSVAFARVACNTFWFSVRGCPSRGVLVDDAVRIEKLCRANTAELGRFMQHLEQHELQPDPTPKRCVIL